jgi:hypothetical protein
MPGSGWKLPSLLKLGAQSELYWEIWDFHGGKHSSWGLLGCDAMQCGSEVIPEDRGSKVLWKNGILPQHMVSQPRGPQLGPLTASFTTQSIYPIYFSLDRDAVKINCVSHFHAGRLRCICLICSLHLVPAVLPDCPMLFYHIHRGYSI